MEQIFLLIFFLYEKKKYIYIYTYIYRAILLYTPGPRTFWRVIFIILFVYLFVFNLFIYLFCLPFSAIKKKVLE